MLLMLEILKSLVEIFIIFLIYYVILLFIRGTRAEQVVKGLLVLGLVYFVAQKLELGTLVWILQNLFAIAVIAFIVIFQPELRQGLANLGKRRLFSSRSPGKKIVKIIVDAVSSLSSRKTGALIAIERRIGLGDYINTGVILDSEPSPELIATIFAPHSPLHDGAVIISRDVIRSAASIFPLSNRPSIVKTLGTRHRAGIGITEETDAFAIIISEETGSISTASGGRLTKDVSENRLTELLDNIYSAPQQKWSSTFWRKK